MSAFKRLIVIVVGIVFGLIFLILGTREIFQIKALQSKGKAASGEVTDWETRRRRGGGRIYYLTVNFTTEIGQAITSEGHVSHSTYEEGVASKKINVTYLPDDPSVCRIGANLKNDFTTVGAGVLFLGAAFMAFRWP